MYPTVAISLSQTITTDLLSARTSDSKNRLLSDIKVAVAHFSKHIHHLNYLITLKFCPRPLSTLRLPLVIQSDLSTITSKYIEIMFQLSSLVETCATTPERSAGIKGALFGRKPKLEDEESEIRNLLKSLEDKEWALKNMNKTIEQ